MNRTSTTYPNGVVQSATYDASDRLESITATKGTATLTSFDYANANAGDDTGLRNRVTDIDANTATYGVPTTQCMSVAPTALTPRPLQLLGGSRRGPERVANGPNDDECA